ncbi:heterokaryon incompatibility protein-domain-containing protein [Daldinia sp. FL1419]|nr:heterokaryon incompatibility protein-domain-containing protein [Daldinia sp. FL1419]
MRLLNTNTLQVAEFTQQRPRYAILSHTWQEDEVSLHDIRNGFAPLRQGYTKVIDCCQQARQDGYEWVWIDTCCIDQTSSAELSEAINSMYRWYAESDICYAYLSDIRYMNMERYNVTLCGNESFDSIIGSTSPGEGVNPSLESYIAVVRRQFTSQLRSSRWFYRGWTLQELIAPRHVEFYNRNWANLGTKVALREMLAEITGIDTDVLLGHTPLSDVSVAVKMSWAAKRLTKREEDMAYCLMGIFDINMPLLYGEGAKAFKRLQREIICQYEDYTLLLYGGSNWNIFLANSPADFGRKIMLGPRSELELHRRHDDKYFEMDARKLRNQTEPQKEIVSMWQDNSHATMALTSRGLQATLLCQDTVDTGYFLAWTRCWYDHEVYGPLLIFISIRRPIGKVAHRREPRLIYVGQAEFEDIESHGNYNWREVYLETHDTPVATSNQTRICISLQCSQNPSEIEALCCSQSFVVTLPITTENNVRLIRIIDQWKVWDNPLLKFPAAVALTIPQRTRDINHIFLIGKINKYDWRLVFHESVPHAVDKKFLTSVLRVWNLKNISNPELAGRFAGSIQIPLSNGEELFISQRFRGNDDITVHVSVRQH